jgi:hypothetical protein
MRSTHSAEACGIKCGIPTPLGVKGGLCGEVGRRDERREIVVGELSGRSTARADISRCTIVIKKIVIEGSSYINSGIESTHVVADRYTRRMNSTQSTTRTQFTNSTVRHLLLGKLHTDLSLPRPFPLRFEFLEKVWRRRPKNFMYSRYLQKKREGDREQGRARARERKRDRGGG